ncbi:MAG: PGPGW domain-containing protein [Chthoniobacterales bacterium]
MGWRAGFRAAVAGLGAVPTPLRKLIVAVIGGTILVIGVVMILLPGPAFIVIPVGLGILATEFCWARHVVDRGKRVIAKARGRDPENVRS